MCKSGNVVDEDEKLTSDGDLDVITYSEGPLSQMQNILAKMDLAIT